MLPKVNNEKSFCKVCQSCYVDYHEVFLHVCSIFLRYSMEIAWEKIFIVVIFWSYRIHSKINKMRYNKMKIIRCTKITLDKIYKWIFNFKSMRNKHFCLKNKHPILIIKYSIRNFQIKIILFDLIIIYFCYYMIWYGTMTKIVYIYQLN